MDKTTKTQTFRRRKAHGGNPEPMVYYSPPPDVPYCRPQTSAQLHGASVVSTGRTFEYVSPMDETTNTKESREVDSSRHSVRIAQNLVSKFLAVGDTSTAANLLQRMEEVGWGELMVEDLTEFAEIATASNAPSSREGDLTTESERAKPKSNWKKNTSNSEKRVQLTDPANVWSAVQNINNCPNDCGRSFVCRQQPLSEMQFNTLMERRSAFSKLPSVEKKVMVCSILEASANAPYGVQDEEVGGRVCLKCLSDYFNTPISTLNTWRREARKGMNAGGKETARQAHLDVGTKSWAVGLFIEWFIRTFGTVQKNVYIDMPWNSMYSNAGEELWLIDKYSPADLKAEFDIWVPTLDPDITVSEVWIKKLWDARLVSATPFTVQVRLDTGRTGGCDTCSRLFVRFREAPRSMKPLMMQARMAHRTYVANQRAFQQSTMLADLDNPNVESMVQDGYDTWKAGVPLYGLSSPGAGAVFAVKTKVSGTINFGQLCTLSLTPPWVATGGNLSVTSFMANLAVRTRRLQPGTEMPKTLKLAVDGGPENWCGTWYSFGAWLVGVGMFSEVYIQRFPAHHGYNGMDATFAPLSTYFYGCKRNRLKGRNVETLEEFVTGMRKAYEARGPGSGILGGKPVVSEIGCTYDFASFIKPYVDPEFHGWGHSTMEWLDDEGARVTGKRGSAIHYLHFFLDTDGVVRLRYKNAPTYPESAWQPLGANGELPDGKKPIGVTPFKCSTSELPVTNPPFSEFKAWDDDGEVQKSILTACRRVGAEFLSEAGTEWWRDFFERIPASPKDVPTAQQPVWGYFERPSTRSSSTVSFSTLALHHHKLDGLLWRCLFLIYVIIYKPLNVEY